MTEEKDLISLSLSLSNIFNPHGGETKCVLKSRMLKGNRVMAECAVLCNPAEKPLSLRSILTESVISACVNPQHPQILNTER